MKGRINQLIILQVNRKRKRGKEGKDGEDIEMEEGEEKGGKKKERGGKPESEKGEKRKVLYPPSPPTISLSLSLSLFRFPFLLIDMLLSRRNGSRYSLLVSNNWDSRSGERLMMITVVDKERLDYPLSSPLPPLASSSLLLIPIITEKCLERRKSCGRTKKVGKLIRSGEDMRRV